MNVILFNKKAKFQHEFFFMNIALYFVKYKVLKRKAHNYQYSYNVIIHAGV